MRLTVARYRAARFAGALPTFAQAKNRQNDFTQEDMAVLLYETAQMVPMSPDELRHQMVVLMRVRYRTDFQRWEGLTRHQPDRIDQIVKDVTRGWEKLRIHRVPDELAGASDLTDAFQAVLGGAGRKPIEGKKPWVDDGVDAVPDGMMD